MAAWQDAAAGLCVRLVEVLPTESPAQAFRCTGLEVSDVQACCTHRGALHSALWVGYSQDLSLCTQCSYSNSLFDHQEGDQGSFMLSRQPQARFKPFILLTVSQPHFLCPCFPITLCVCDVQQSSPAAPPWAGTHRVPCHTASPWPQPEAYPCSTPIVLIETLQLSVVGSPPFTALLIPGEVLRVYSFQGM